MSATGQPLITPPPNAQHIGDIQKRIVIGLQSGGKVVFTPGDENMQIMTMEGKEIPFDRVVGYLSEPDAILVYSITGVEIMEEEKPKLVSSTVHIYQRGVESISEVSITPAFDAQNAS